MEKYFRKACKFYKDYFMLKDELNKELDTMKKSGNYSNAYLRGMESKHEDQLLQERHVITERIMNLKEEFKKDLSDRYDLEKHSISDKLQKILASNIDLNSREMLELAEKHKGNLTESRLLHDYALTKGYELSNYIPYETVVQNFDNHCKHISDSIYAVDAFLMPYANSDNCDFEGGRYCKASMFPKMEIETIPHSIEESIARDLAKSTAVTREQMEAFIIGLNGSLEEKEEFRKKVAADKMIDMSESEKLEYEISMLTSVEKADAKSLAIYHGHEEITQTEIDYIHSPDYEKVLAEREATT